MVCAAHTRGPNRGIGRQKCNRARLVPRKQNGGLPQEASRFVETFRSTFTANVKLRFEVRSLPFAGRTLVDLDWSKFGRIEITLSVRVQWKLSK